MSPKKSLVFAKIPDAGLANMLLAYCEGALYAKKHNLPLTVSRWFRFRLGPFIRFEKSKRIYINNFNAPKLSDFIKRGSMTKGKTEVNPVDFAQIPQEDCVYIFDKTPEYYDFTANLRNDREIVKDLVKDLVRKKVWQRVDSYEQPVIGMHVRLGDFKRANISTDIAYFIKALRQIRQQHGTDLPATIFSDGTEAELEEILAEGNVKIAKTAKDLDDLLLLSRSKYFVLSQDSSFGYFASLISKGDLICKPSNKNGIVTNDIPEMIISPE
jgi:hypothetical protein